MSQEPKYVPHDQITPGYWYVAYTAHPGWQIVSVVPNVLKQQVKPAEKPELTVFMTDREGDVDVDEFEFIGPVAPPAGYPHGW